ncbi:MAG: MoaD/ThiS family protein [Bryobacteraceae bacterium]
MIRVVLPGHLRVIAKCGAEVTVAVDGAPSIKTVLDAVEARYPALRGTIRDQGTGVRRPFLRFFACQQDLSHDPLESPLPEAVVRGAEPLIVLAAIAGGLS